jgi:hypothetical protein
MYASQSKLTHNRATSLCHAVNLTHDCIHANRNGSPCDDIGASDNPLTSDSGKEHIQ